MRALLLLAPALPVAQRAAACWSLPRPAAPARNAFGCGVHPATKRLLHTPFNTAGAF